MKPLPLPLRVAAGLAVTTAERVRELPKQVIGLPVTVASQVLQLSMRVQQHVTELAIRGDDALSTLRPVEDTPSWATFDEDIEPGPSAGFDSAGFDNVTPIDIEIEVEELDTELPRPREAHGETNNGHLPEVAGDPWAQEERALAEGHEDGEHDTGPGPAGVANYDELTLPQLRARLRRLTLAQLEELLAYERDHGDRPSFTGMLARRIGNVHRAEQGDGGGDTDTASDTDGFEDEGGR
ncbi:lipid droplet-associated protein [Amycolatopsis nigrescens]|uniref:lipid droplet-associated protein n=1 Tax=Amycolatopsis nigrescens TaxID=381445 RepID=UPI0003634AF0|nr:lipid droplet-associated protein [Amycolatopsis nigrescens]